MSFQKNDKIRVCPHCGFENPHAAVMWLNCVNDEDSIICQGCRKEIFDTQSRNSVDSGKVENRKFNLRFMIITILLLGFIIYLNRIFDVLSFKEDTGQIVYEILFILVVSSSIAAGKMWKNLGYLAIWGGIFILLLTGYSFRYELSGVKDKLVAELIPDRGYQKYPNSISFPLSSDGHFYIRAEVNGIPLTFLADTGASSIVLTPDDAEKLGIDLNELKFDRLYETANGMVRGSLIRIDDFKVGGIHLEEIGASVNEVNMQHSLLGMTFFKRLKSYEVKDDVLTLHWKRY